MKESCPFCGSTVSLVDSAKVYGRSYGWMYLCDSYPKCDARVGCHPNSTVPLGTLANHDLREWRKKTHALFDPLWKSGKMKRHEAYRWLSQKLGIPRGQTHIAMFDIEQCQATIALVRQELTESRLTLFDI